MSGKEQCDRDVIETMGRESVSCIQHAVEVVGVPIVADKAENRNPKVCFE